MRQAPLIRQFTVKDGPHCVKCGSADFSHVQQLVRRGHPRKLRWFNRCDDCGALGEYMPSRQDIAAEAQQISAGWSEEERERRCGECTMVSQATAAAALKAVADGLPHQVVADRFGIAWSTLHHLLYGGHISTRAVCQGCGRLKSAIVPSDPCAYCAARQSPASADPDGNDPLSMPLAELGVDVRSLNQLSCRGIVTVGDALGCTRGQLLAIPYFGQESLNRLLRLLAGIGYARAA